MQNAPYPLHEIVEFPSILRDTPGFQELMGRMVDMCHIPRFLAGSGVPLTPEAENRLSWKLVAHLLDQMTTDRLDAPYISVWQSNRHQEVKMIYVNPAIEKITGFTAQQVLKVGFSIFVPDDTITRIDHKDGAMQLTDVPIERARQERQRHQIDGRWERVYEILNKDGTAFVRDVAVIEEIGDVCISTGTLTDVTLEFQPV